MLWLLYGVLPPLLFGLPTVLMGLSFPVLQRAVQDDPRTSGRKVGLLQAANIAGCVGGSLILGLLGLRTIGTTGSLRLLMVAGIGFAIVGFRSHARRREFVLAAALLAPVAVMLPTPSRLWRRLHGTGDPTPLGPDRGEGWSGMSTEHVVARSVRDSAALPDVTCGPDTGAPYFAPPPQRPFIQEVGAAPGRLRIGLVARTPARASGSPECEAGVARGA